MTTTFLLWVLPWLLMTMVTGYALPLGDDLMTSSSSWMGNTGKDYDYGELTSGDSSDGARWPRSCNQHTIKTLHSRACGSNYNKKKRSVSSAPSQHQLSPISINVVVVEYYFPQGTSSPQYHPWSHPFSSGEPTSNHINGAMSPEGPEVVLIHRPVSFPLHPEMLDPLASPQFWENLPLKGHGLGASSPLLLKWEEGVLITHLGDGPPEILSYSRELPRRAPERAAELKRVTDKCCSVGGCGEKDFVNLCYME